VERCGKYLLDEDASQFCDDERRRYYFRRII
jgi:hypothetical protein